LFSWLARAEFPIRMTREGLAMASKGDGRPTGGELSIGISNGMVHLLREYTGRGPTKARTTIGRDHVLIMLQDTLTRGERTLVDAGYAEQVLLTRRRFQEVMRPEASKMIEDLTGRQVVGFMSDNHANPDLGVEVFILEPDGQPAALEEGESTDAG
jgi:uncharacterized protein YbcI